MNSENRNIVAAIDIGTTKVVAIIADKKGNSLNILGFGVAPSEGVSRGVVANIQKTAESIKEALTIASNNAGVHVERVNIGVAGEHIKSMRHRNYVTINNLEGEITEGDLDRLIAEVKTIKVSGDQQILHIIPEEYTVDHELAFESPIGMAGKKLEALNHVVLASSHALQNIRRAVEKAGYRVHKFVLQPIASSMSVLEESELDLGVALIDIGGGTTDLAVFHEGNIKYTKVIGIAGKHVTNDIKVSLGIIQKEAEKLKREYGYAHEGAIIRDETLFINRVGARGNVKIPITLLTQIISLRMQELFVLINKELKKSEYKDKLTAGIVLTGGGSLLHGCEELASEVFGIPTRLGYPMQLPTNIENDLGKPEYATVVGLLKDIPGDTVEEPEPTEPVITVTKKEEQAKHEEQEVTEDEEHFEEPVKKSPVKKENSFMKKFLDFIKEL